MSDATATRRGAADEDVLGKAYDVQLVRRVWTFVRPHWPLLLVGLALVPLTVAFELAQPYLIKLAIDDHITVGAMSGLQWIAAGYVALVVLQALSGYAQQYALSLLGQRSMRDLRVALYAHVITRRAAFFDRMPVGRLLTRTTTDIEAINEAFAAGVVLMIVDLVKLIAIVVLMLMLNAELAVMTFLSAPLLIVVVEYSRRLMRRSFREIRVKLAAMNAYLAEHLAGVKVVQLFTRERAALAEFNELNAAHRDAYLGAIRADVSLFALVEAIGAIAVACIAYYASGNIGDALTVGLVVAFIEYVNKAFIPIRDMSAKYTVMQSAMAATERIFALLDTQEPDAPTDAATTAADERPAERSNVPAIALRDLSFCYRADEPILRGISLSIRRGETVAVVGPTGSGKSTLIRLLTRLYEPTGGAIELFGRPIQTIPADELRARVAVVSQDVFMFTGSVADNVRLGKLDADRATVEAALRRVGADRVLARRGADADEMFAERGTNFSAGERQLVAFARALVRDPEILVLDEATAHVDPEAERVIERGLEELMRGRTSLVIAHRLSTVRRADRIVVVSRGQIVEQGTHRELVAAGGVYARLEGTVIK